MKPYYQDDWTTIYHGDCIEVMAGLDKVDAAITDPPYGIGFKYDQYDDTRDNWFRLMAGIVPLAQDIAKFTIMPCGQFRHMAWWYANFPPEWLICWYKGSPGHRSHVGFNDWEPHLCWGKPPGQIHDYFQTKCGFDNNGHPCPKPIEWAMWLVSRGCPDGGRVLDPFMGSGTTLRAAKDSNRKSIGIDISEKYCEVAANRMAQEVFDFT
jgi:site-specific DNA-methyltransferase (adenine-specific)